VALCPRLSPGLPFSLLTGRVKYRGGTKASRSYVAFRAVRKTGEQTMAQGSCHSPAPRCRKTSRLAAKLGGVMSPSLRVVTCLAGPRHGGIFETDFYPRVVSFLPGDWRSRK
jgi:hypothetical protein